MSEREAFEEWARASWYGDLSFSKVEQRYNNVYTYDAWLVWQAATAHERERKDSATLRARVEELEGALRGLVEYNDPLAVEHDETHPVVRARRAMEADYE